MTETKHMPTPWRVGDAGATVFAPKGHSPLMVAQRLNRDDAAFIVRACNSHDELVAALAGMLEWARRVKDANSGPEVAAAVTALAKATAP